MNKQRVIIIGIMGLAFILTPLAVFGQEQGFLERFKEELASKGLTTQEIAEIMLEAQNRNWEGIDNEFAEMAALTLQLCQRSRFEMSGQEKLELVYHLSAMGAELKALGFKEQHIARIAFNTTREYIDRLRLQDKERDLLRTQEMIRDRIHAELCSEGLQQQKEELMQRLQVRVRNSMLKNNRNRDGGPKF
jgi:hypothetical protein